MFGGDSLGVTAALGPLDIHLDCSRCRAEQLVEQTVRIAAGSGIGDDHHLLNIVETMCTRSGLVGGRGRTRTCGGMCPTGWNPDPVGHFGYPSSIHLRSTS